MAASTTELPASVLAQPATRVRASRCITPEAGHALETLGHSIEYLADQLVHRGAPVSPGNGDLQAIQLLMALNRQIYFECPEVHSFAQRCLSFLHLHSAESDSTIHLR